MLAIITLNTIDKIFTEVAEVPLSAMAKMLYINCLTHYFRDRPPTTVDANAFGLAIGEIPKYEKLLPHFRELDRAGLIKIELTEVRFLNCWNKYIDKSRVSRVSPETFLGNYAPQDTASFKKELLAQEITFENIQMKYKIDRKRVEELIDIFFKEQDFVKKKYSNFSDCAGHFWNWLPKHVAAAGSASAKSGREITGITGVKVMGIYKIED